MPFKFPFTNYHELNLDWIIKKIEEITKIFEESSETITIYEERLADAEQDAADALAAAGSAVTTATQADTAASAASAAASAASAAAAQAQTRAGQAEAAADAAQQTANAAQIAAQNAENIVQNFVITPSNFTIEPDIYTVTYDPNNTTISPASIVFYSYVFVGGVKSPYTAAKLTAYAVHDGLTMPATQVDVLDASSLTFPVPAYLDKDDYIVVKAFKSPEAYVYQEVAYFTVPVISEGLDAAEDDNKAPVIISSAAGAIASFPDGADDLPAKKITAYIEPVQDLHGQAAPYPAGGGKNLLNLDFTSDSNTVAGMTFTHSGASFTLQGTATGTSYSIFTLSTPPDAELNTDYTFSLTISGTCPGGLYGITFKSSGTTVRQYRCNTTDATEKTFQIPSAYDSVDFTLESLTNGLVFDCEIKVQFEKGSTKTAWAPYSNICPISGWTAQHLIHTGKNLLDSNDQNYGNYTITSAGNETAGNDRISSGFIPCKAGVDVILSTNSALGTDATIMFPFAGIAAFDSSQNYIDRTYRNNSRSVPFTTPANTAYIRAFFQERNSSIEVPITPSIFDDEKIQLEFGSSYTDFEPANGFTDYQINMPVAAGTVYGGYVEVNEDGSWKIGIELAMNTLDGTQTLMNNGVLPYGGIQVSYTPNPTKALAVNKSYENLKSNLFKASDNGVVYEINGRTSNSNLYLNMPSDVTTVDQAQTWFSNNNTQVVYKLATPQVYTLSAAAINTYFGTNNFFNNAGDTAVEYRADTKLYIERLTMPDDQDMIADANIASGKFFMVGNDLYISTASIAAGEVIAPSVNCTRLSLADALNSL